MKNEFNKTPRCLSLIAVIAWAMVIFAFSAQNAEASTVTSDGFMHMFLRIFIKNDAMVNSTANSIEFLVRKCAHFTIYFILGALVFNLFEKYCVNSKILLTVTVCCLYAVSDEIHQYFVPGRACRLLDVFIDTCGSICGSYLLKLIKSIFANYKHQFK